MTTVYQQAREMARSGLGYEDLMVRLRDKGLKPYEAEFAVFGKLIAMRREARRQRMQAEREAS
jgi:hypothetical protein